MRYPFRFSAIALGIGALASACGGSSSTSSSPSTTTAASGASSAGASNNYGLKFNADGTPILTGMSFKLGIAAGNPVPGDTTNYILSQTLKSWGAKVSYTIGSGSSMQLAVLSGQLQVADGQEAGAADSGLVIIAPAMTHVDLVLVSSKFTSIDQMKGQTVAGATSIDPSSYLGPTLSKAMGWGANGLVMTYPGSDSSVVNELISGKTVNGFVAAEDLVTLKQHGTFNVIKTAGQIAPEYADSFNAATPAWANANPAMVEAIDLAWWHAAWVFNHDTAAWDAAAEKYTNNAATPADVVLQRQALEAFKPWPDTAASADQNLSLATVKTNYDANLAAGEIKGAGVRSIASQVDLAPWQASAKIVAKYPSIY
ncbi:MAG: hypothetical protein HKL84_06000 [Acidimicrobiaceae bacterium]|nr:hypothetical protein [Acidimicrobiaceae bacterium]